MNTTSTNPDIKAIGSIYLYNMLQDFRHLLVFDFRANFEDLHIRDAFHVHPGLNIEQVMEVIDLAERKATEKETKYKTLQRVRRYFFVGAEKLDPNNEGVRFVMKCLAQRKSKEDKYYSLSDNFQVFQNKYKFMLLDRFLLEEAAKKTVDEYNKVLLYPYAKFPSQIIADRIYLGNVYSSNSQRQLADLGIVSLFDFIDYSLEDKKAEFKETHDNYFPFPINQNITVVVDFDYINKMIDEQAEKGRVLLYCKDGQSISPAFAISYLMYKAKLSVQMATLKVCQAISRVELNKMVYSQLLLYKPKK